MGGNVLLFRILQPPKLIFFCAICVVIFIFVTYSMYEPPVIVIAANQPVRKENVNTSMKFILQWTLPDTIPFIYMGVGQEKFLEKNCQFTNCYVTSDRTFLKDLTYYDVIAFHAPELYRNKYYRLPNKRAGYQKYIFASIESSHYYPICHHLYDRFFNWTWTYKLNSDVPFEYIAVRNKAGEVIGPKKEMHWMEVKDMEPLTSDVKNKLKSKNKAAAWFVSNCDALSKRQYFVKDVQRELKKYNLTVDVYGKCGRLHCSIDEMDECFKSIERDYYFYFSLENSFSEDYVTEKLLHSLKNYAIPVVYGGANYTRFMPDGIYLDGRKMGAKNLAAKMKQIVDDKEMYYNYFKWHNHYSFHAREEAADTDEYCRLCEMINNNSIMTEPTVYNDLKKWWNPPNIC